MAKSNEVQQLGIDGNSVKREVNRNIKNSFDAFNEYIWNAIDAGAKNILINIKKDSKYIKELSIKDDGSGIDYKQLNKRLFGKFNVSPKSDEKETQHSLPHGEKGFGRFSFIKFANDVTWNTVYEDDDNNKYKYSIKINKNSLDNYSPTNPVKTNEPTGTETIFNFESMTECGALVSNNTKDILDKLKDNIVLEFCWILELFDINIKLNNQKLTYEDYKEPTVIDKDITIKNEKFDIKFIKWKQQLKNQSSRYYLLDSQNNEVFVKTTTLNNKGDDFYHSLYIKSSYFDDFHILKTKSEEAYVALVDYIDKYLKEKRKPYIKKFADNKFERFKKEKILPKFSKFEEQVKKPLYEKAVKDVISFAPALVSTKTNTSQVRVLLQLINKLLDDDKSRDTLYDILSVLLDDENEEYLDELRRLLDNYGLKNILGTIQLVERRKNTLKRLKKMVYDDSQYYLESDLQQEIEDAFWIFGEEYNLMIGSEEDDFNKLRDVYCQKVLKIKPEEYDKTKASKKQVDLFICAESGGRIKKHLVIEIKKPKHYLKTENYRQLEDYRAEIDKMPIFNSKSRHSWDYILMYTDLSNEHKLFFERKIRDAFTGDTVDSTKGNRIFVRKWSDLLEEASFRMEYIYNELEKKKKKMVSDKETKNK